MDSAEILASLQHPVFVTDASKSLSYINECARHTLCLPSSGHLTLEDVLQKLMTKEGAPLTREALGGIVPLRVSLSSDDFLRVDAVLNAHTLSDHSTCYELNLFQNGTSTAIDPLTGLMDRGHMLKLIGTKRREGKGALILINIDRLKIINDFLGYDVGDHVIHALGHAFRQQTHASVSLARWSGHEFMALVPENLIQKTAQFAELFNTIARELPLAKAINLPGRKLSVSIGYTRFGSSNVNNQDPLTEVNAAVYEAKRAGRNRAIDARQLNRPSIYITGGALETALLEERIVAAVQPIFDLKTGQIVADESLARMITQGGDVIAAGEFIAAAASLQLAHRIDQSIIKQTINYCVTSHFSAPRAHFVNISGDFLHHPELIEETIVSAMNACACTHPDQASARQSKPLVIEITERELVDDTQEALRALQPLLDFGLRLALDDFGSGYSSYRYLLDLPFSFLKVEGELIRHITTNDKARRIVQHIQHMAQDLGLITVAEFITDQATADMLAQMGVDWGQGFHLGKPELIQRRVPRKAVAG
ncbi:bifunctional diguanylate cyclase/phosphodiesterase [Halothiobacillus sp.]|uniref:bifunctional diguanylate cyclase/phosphodiesterase n=1 Tax=Halothiobacillus sp. TaxID=1891311 RepID=UPI00260F3707|nr:bifunctional diguanylate cyclase/phosphodiesterase [Halothiobacillus sp.]